MPNLSTTLKVTHSPCVSNLTYKRMGPSIGINFPLAFFTRVGGGAVINRSAPGVIPISWLSVELAPVS